MKYLSSLEAYCIVGGQNVDDNEDAKERDGGYTFTYTEESDVISIEEARELRRRAAG